jgi:beta-lactamase class A
LRVVNRRQLILGWFSAAITDCVGSHRTARVSESHDGRRALADIERRIGGRIGVFAIDTGTGRTIEQRADERFAMCSTFKWLLAAAVLERVDCGELALQQMLAYTEADLLEYAPVTRAKLSQGALNVEELARAAVVVSDNTAANLLLAKTGGPPALTRFARALGDSVTRLDRIEPELNTNHPADPRDTTSPRAMAILMRRVLCGDALSSASRERLYGWLRACETGNDRLRSGLPHDWIVGHKTGSGARSAINDVAITWPPARPPILIAAYASDSQASVAQLAKAEADIAALVAHSM